MPAVPTWSPAAPALVELANSGEINFDDVATFTQMYSGKYDDCVDAALPKGTAGSGDTAGLYVKTCNVKKSRGEIGTLTIIWSGYSGDGGSGEQIPGDEYGLEPFEINPPLERNSARFGTLYPSSGSPSAAVIALQDLVTQAHQGATDAIRSEKFAAISSSPAGATAIGQAIKVATLLRKGTTNYYLAGFRYSWVLYFVTQPAVTAGGFIETPSGPFGATISGLGLSCLRTADDLKFANGFFVLTRSWLCGPSGHWSSDLYP